MVTIGAATSVQGHHNVGEVHDCVQVAVAEGQHCAGKVTVVGADIRDRCSR